MAESRRRELIYYPLGVGVLAGLIVEGVKGFPITRFVGRVLSAVIGWLREPYLVERWYLTLIFLVAATSVIVFVGRRLLSGPLGPPYADYRKDRFYGVEWQWQYGSQGQIRPDSFTAYCPRCSLMLQYVNAGMYSVDDRTGLQCIECKYNQIFENTSVTQLKHNVGILIERNIRQGRYPNAPVASGSN